MRAWSALLAVLFAATPPNPGGSWGAVLDLAGGTLPFSVWIERSGSGWRGELCNGRRCNPFSAVRVKGDSVTLELADYAATITARLATDSLTGSYHNIGNRGPRTIPFRAGAGPVARDASAGPPAGPLGRHLLQRFRRQPAGVRAPNGTAG